ncbi:hypothetical protein I4U23_012253 [Adineta vaga]|nr:hypothetical protein I4U23_012253 [Adineta vaga]
MEIETCKKPFRALCYCCQHKLCIVHLNEHFNLINAQSVPLVDEINTLFDLFKTISSSRPSFLLELETWRQDACGKIDNLYQTIRQEFEETLAEERIKQKNELDQLRNRIDKLIEEEEASQKDIDTISGSIQS